MGICTSREEQERLRRKQEARRKNTRTLRLKSEKEINADKMMNENEVKRSFIEQFDKYDKDKNGLLDLDEVTKFFEDLLERRNEKDKRDARELAKQLIRMIDINNDGKVSREEIYLFYRE